MLVWYEALPIFWLILICIVDAWTGFGLRLFYCNTLKDFVMKKDELRSTCENDVRNCPLFRDLVNNANNFDAYCPKKITPNNNSSQNIWLSLKHMCNRYQQMAFFEVIVLQFFIGFVAMSYTNPAPIPLPFTSPILNITQINVGYFYLLLAILFLHETPAVGAVTVIAPSTYPKST